MCVEFQFSSMEGFMTSREKGKQDMPQHLSYLFRARRPIEPLRALHTPVYKNKPLQPLLDKHHAGGEENGTILGSVPQEKGETWFRDVFEDSKPQA